MTKPHTPVSTNTYSNLGRKSLQRSWWRHWIYPLLFLVAMVLSLSTYLTLDSIQQSVQDYVADNQRALVGGDLVLRSRQPWPESVLDVATEFEPDDVVYDYQFNAMISDIEGADVTESESLSLENRTAEPSSLENATIENSNSEALVGEHTLLARVKGVSSNYPLYGEVELASGKPLWQQLKSGHVVVETQVLTGLELDVGDTVKIGDATFVIADELLAEPDRPLTAFGFGARVLMADTDLDATNLMGQRSRISYRIELASTPETILATQTKLEPILEALPLSQEIKVSTADEADTSVTEMSDNVLMFLKLLVIAVLFLSAVALLSVVKAFVSLQQTANAIRRALGESVTAIKRSYYLLFVLMAVVACALSAGLSLLMLNVGAQYLTAILPADVQLSIKLVSLIKISIVALAITLLVVQHSLYAVTHTKPSAVLKQATSNARQHPPAYWYLAVLVASFGLMAYEFGSAKDGLQVLGGMLVLAGGFWLLGKGWLWLLSRLANKGLFGFKLLGKQSNWMARIALHNLSRKGNQSGLFFVTLALSVAVLTMITLLNHSLNTQFVQAYPEDAPNLFMLDVQSNQHDDLNALVDAPITYYPVVRARVSEAGGVPAADIEVARGEGDDPTRIFNLSYADTVMETEFIKKSIEPNQLYAPLDKQATDSDVVPLSILDSAADLLNVGMGDQIRFNIQGIEIVGQITSIRERYERGPSPFFYFLFEPEVLADAPQIQFATTKVDAGSIPQLQTDLARQFPAITTIDGGAIAKRVQGFVAQMSRLVQLFTVLAIITGLMVLITSLLSTSQDRLRDSASFRLLGMQTADLYKINILEIGLLGISAGMFAVVLASGTAYVLITEWFNLRFSVPWASFGLGAVMLVAVLLIIAVSYVRLVIGRGIMARVRGMV
ncbi:ABC transporter permease [Psychrobacter sp. FDAARGOS_221]|uniref:ABC transporter permease n=1 Tax=Psychrobacter sp. FDAARGOS_221 TaxID=1975705 RepID=UPI000BB5339D|nr:FtsX-like permease family protein [Psychrobacter sp. FDAARGOS_221]PNK60656.1 ABC transporter substrate-binding protein [Psychrobacter sp. FDAARGOS_221]